MKVVVCRVDQLPVGERTIVKAGVRSIGVFNVDGEYFAIRNRCPHQGGPLCLGRLSPSAVSDTPGEVTLDRASRLLACPWHGWEYDLETGQSFMGPGEGRVKAYGVTVAKGATLGGAQRAQEQDILGAARALGREPGPYVAETFPVYVEADYLVVDV